MSFCEDYGNTDTINPSRKSKTIARPVISGRGKQKVKCHVQRIISQLVNNSFYVLLSKIKKKEMTGNYVDCATNLILCVLRSGLRKGFGLRYGSPRDNNPF